MKNKILTITAFLLFSLSYTNAQLIAKVKPAKRKMVLVKHKKHKTNHVWIAGHWKWSSKSHQYVWSKGKWAKAKKGHTWIAGHWKRRQHGFLWIEGHWS